MNLRAFFKMLPFSYAAPGILKSKPKKNITCVALRTYFKGHYSERSSGDGIQKTEFAIIFRPLFNVGIFET
jgi:hypothetical protein